MNGVSLAKERGGAIQIFLSGCHDSDCAQAACFTLWAQALNSPNLLQAFCMPGRMQQEPQISPEDYHRIAPLTSAMASGAVTAAAAAAAALFWTSRALLAAAFCAALRSLARRLRSLRASASRAASAWRSRAFSFSSSSLAAVSSLWPAEKQVRIGLQVWRSGEVLF